MTSCHAESPLYLGEAGPLEFITGRPLVKEADGVDSSMTPGTRKVVRYLLLGLLGLVLLCWAGMEVLIARGKSRIEGRLRQIDAEIAGLSESRALLWSPAVPGNAREDHDRACELVGDDVDWVALQEFLGRTPKGSRERVLKALADKAAALDAFSRGARRSMFIRKPCPELEGEFRENDRAPRDRRLRSLAMLGLCQARVLFEDGRTSEGVECLLDLVQTLSDLHRDGGVAARLVSVWMLRSVLDELHEVVQSESLPARELDRLEPSLEALESGLPRRRLHLLSTLELQGRAIVAGKTPELVRMWRGTQASGLLEAGAIAFLSSRPLAIASFHRQDGWISSLKDADQGPYGAARALEVRVVNELSETWNPLDRLFLPGFMSGVSRRSLLTQSRLLRTAVRYRRTGELPILGDPFGAALLIREEAGELTVWSVGPDERDDDGSGDFQGSGKDMVLKVRR